MSHIADFVLGVLFIGACLSYLQFRRWSRDAAVAAEMDRQTEMREIAEATASCARLQAEQDDRVAELAGWPWLELRAVCEGYGAHGLGVECVCSSKRACAQRIYFAEKRRKDGRR